MRQSSKGGDAPSPPFVRAARFRVADREVAVLSFSIPSLRFPPELTPAERAIAGLVCEGHSASEVATLRGRSRNTIVNEMRSIYAKLGVHSRAELVQRLTKPGCVR